MPSIQRRAFLGAVATVSAVSGCLTAPASTESATRSDVPPATDSPTATAPTTDTTTSDAIQVDVRNQDAAETTVGLRLTTGDEMLLGRRVTVPADGRRTVDSGIDETGEYELEAFVVGGPDLAFESTFAIDDYDLRHGSNVVLFVDGEHIDMLLEE